MRGVGVTASLIGSLNVLHPITHKLIHNRNMTKQNDADILMSTCHIFIYARKQICAERTRK